MKKIGSYVLMAVMMLVGTNAWATTRTAGNATEFTNAWQAAQDGDVIKLTNDINIEKILWLGTAKMNDTPKSITLDLNGWMLQNSSATLKYMFFISHGELNVITSQPGGKIIQNGATNEELFRLVGSTYKDVNPKTAESGYFTRLFIDEGVKVRAEVKNAIVLDQLGATAWPLTSTNAISTAGVSLISGTTSPYNTSVFGSSTGTANGVRVDVKGSIYGKKYAFKANGNIGGPSNNTKADLTGYYSNKAHTVQYAKAAGDENYSPFIRIYGSADLRVPATSDASKKPVAVYCSGYSRWLIEGTCVGSTGVYVKSGDVDINDATIESNYTGDYQAVEPTKSGVTGSGSAIVIESNAAYPGSIDVTVSGDSHVTATNGYAVEENVTSATTTKVDAITINGGTFEGGQVPDPEDNTKTTQGTITITGETVNNITTTVTITGGQVNGTGDDNVNIGGKDLEDYLSDADTETHMTTISDGKGGTTVVITQGEAPTPATSVKNATDGTSVKWKNATGITKPMSETLEGNLNLDELDITQTAYTQTLTIPAGKTLNAKRVILGEKAKIIVEAGATFVVSGAQGITANYDENIVLETSSTAQGIFLVNPAVNSNKHPKAQVKLYSKACSPDGSPLVWQRFGVPSFESEVKRSAISYDNVTYPSVFRKRGEYDWESVPADEKLVPFACYAVNTNSKTAGAIYTFSCNLVGNSDATLKLTNKWNYYANSYTAPISIPEIINDYNTKFTNVSGTVYLHDAATDLWYEINNATPNIHPEWPSVISPMHAFIIHRRGAGNDPIIDYAGEVYNPLVAPSPAPVRGRATSFATAVIEIVAADGTKDEVSLIEGGQFSAEYDNTYDAEKLMNVEKTYIFADGMDDKLGIIATDNLEGTTLSMETKEQTSFIMKVSRANGMNYVIRDMLTGTETELVEGATYMFSVPANTTVDGRFQISSPRKVATAIDNVEELAATKGIYNLAGQYMGNDYHKLAAGVYVVDGKKIVK